MTGDRGHCPKCGRFCGSVTARYDRNGGIASVDGICRVHATVDLSEQDWEWDDFEGHKVGLNRGLFLDSAGRKWVG